MKYIKLFEAFDIDYSVVEYHEGIFNLVKDRLLELDDSGYGVYINGSDDILTVVIIYGEKNASDKQSFKSSDVKEDCLSLISELDDHKLLLNRFFISTSLSSYRVPEEGSGITTGKDRYHGLDTDILVDYLDKNTYITGIKLSFIHYGAIVNQDIIGDNWD